MHMRVLRTPLVLFLIVTLLTPTVAQALPAAPVAGQRQLEQPTGSIPVNAAALTAADWQDGRVAEAPAPAAPTAVAGRLLLSPAIDADGNPLTNPVGAVPVARVGGDDRTGDVLYAEISLAAEVTPDQPDHNPAGAMVTFRVWHETEPVALVREVRSDAWGAAATQLLFDDLHLTGRWFYQASAPGYGETEVRYFTFDTTRFSEELRLGAARVTTQVEASGRLVVDISSDVAIDDSLSAVELLVFQQEAASGEGDAQEHKMLPPMLARRVDEHHARAELFLDGGNYLLTTLVHSGSIVAQSEPFAIDLDAVEPPAIQQVATVYEPDAGDETVLAHYYTPDGDVALMRRNLTDLPPPADPVEPALLEQTRRVGAFKWQVETYSLAVQVNADDGKKRAYLDGFSWDPIARRYDIAIESLMDAPVEDKLTVQVLGPGDVVIYEETVSILLDPEQPLRYSVSVPSDLGEPHGLRVTVHDPLEVEWLVDEADVIFRDVVNSIDQLLPDGAELTGSIKLSLQVIGIEIASWVKTCGTGFGCLPANKGGLLFSPGDWLTIVTDGVRNFLRDNFNVSSIEEGLEKFYEGLPLGTGSFAVILGVRYTRALYRQTRCSEPAYEQAARTLAQRLGRMAQETAGRINSRLSELSTKFQAKPNPDWPFPGTSFLAVRFSPITAFQIEGGYREPYYVYGEFNGNFGMQVQLLLMARFSWTSLLGNLWEQHETIIALWRLLEGLTAVNDLYRLILGAAQYRGNGQCEPKPKGNPDDRRDAPETQFIATPSGASGQVAYLQERVTEAQRLGLERAEIYWTVSLRQAEYSAFSLDPTEVISTSLEREAILAETTLRMEGLTSGAILPEPGQTITQAMRLAGDNHFYRLGDTSALHRRRELQDAVDFAQRQYNALHGQELALQQELRAQLAQAGIGVLDGGLVTWTLTALNTLGVSGRPVQILPGVASSYLPDSRYYTPFEAPPVLLVPSGGFYRYGDSQEARAWLDTYVNLGGTLLVLAQADSQDWDLLPGGEVEGLGYEQDILCKTASVSIVNSSPWIKGISRDLPDIQLDGSFTAWPADATVVLMRTTGNQMPAMIEYDYGAGHVVATSTYPDWYINGMQSPEDIVFARSLFGLAYLQATGQSVAATASAPGAPVNLPVPVTNNMAVDAAEMTVMRDYYQAHVGEAWRWAAHRPQPLQGSTVVDLVPDLPSGDATTVNVGFNAPPQAGIFRSGYFLGSPGNTAYVPPAWYRSGGISGPFYEVQSSYTPPPGFSLRASRDRFAFGETATITATLHNPLATPRTVTLEPVTGLDDGPVVLNLPALGTVQQVYTTRIYGRREIRLGLSEGGALRSVMPLTLRLSPPFLGLETATDQLPAGLATTVAVSATLVDGRASQVAWEARRQGALVDSATTALSPSGAYSLTTATLSLPAAVDGDEITIRAALVGAAGVMTRTLAVRPPMALAGVSLAGPLMIGDGNVGAVRVQVEDAGYPGSGQAQAFLRRNSDLAVLASGPIQPVTLGGGSQRIDLDLPLPAVLDAAQGYSVVVEGTGQASGGAPVAVSRVLALPPIALAAVLTDALRAVREPMPIRVYRTSSQVGLLPSGPFTVTVSSTTPPFSTATVVPATLIVSSLIIDAVVPSLPRGGEYDVTVQTPQLQNWSKSDILYMADHDLHYSAPAALAAGQSLAWTVSNRAGVDTSVAGALVVLDDDGVVVAQEPVSATVDVGASAVVTLTVPAQLRSGDYRLRWTGVDHLGNAVGDEHLLALTGLEVGLDTQTDKPAYLSNETVSALGVITPSAPLEDAQLRLRVVSRGDNPYFGDYGEPGMVVTTVAGGVVDAPAAGKALRLDPDGIAFGPTGDYVLLGSDRVIQRVNTFDWSGRVVAGRSGMGNTAVDGVGLAARFATDLMTLSLSGDGSFAIVAEFGRGVIRRYDTATGQVSFVAGGGGGCADGVGTVARFNFPSASAVSHDGSFALVTDTCGLRYIDLTTSQVTTLVPGSLGFVAIAPDDSYALMTETSSHVVSRVTLPGGVRTVVAGTAFVPGSADGVGAAARFNKPTGIAISDDGTFALVNDSDNYTVRRISLPGMAVTTLAGAAGQQGFVDGTGNAARFSGMRHLAISPDASYALVGDSTNSAVRRLDLATVAVTTVLGNWPGADGLGNEARFEDPWDVAVSPDGSFALIANPGSATVRRMDLTTGAVTTLAGAFDQYGTVDGIGAAARFSYPAGVAISPDGATALVVDDVDDVVRKIDLATAEVTTMAGAAGQSGFVNAIGGAARFYYPEDVVFSPDSSYALIADEYNNAIRKLDMATAAVTTFLAPGAGGIHDPTALDISPDGSFALVVSSGDKLLYRVEISGGAAGAVTVLAGSGDADVVDGIGTAASFGWPQGVAISPDGLLALVSERFPGVIRQVDISTAQVTTVAGAPWEDDTMRDGPGAAARIYWPIGLDFGPDGTWALTAVQLGNAVARLDLTTLPKAQVQSAVNRLPNNDGSGFESRLYYPSDVAVSADGRYALIADSGNYEIRLLELVSPEAPAVGQGRAPFDPHAVSVRTVAGQAGAWGSDDGIGSAARFDWVEGVAVNGDAQWGLIADTYNQTIRHIDILGGQVTTIAGEAGVSGSDDGVGSAAHFDTPFHLAISPDESFALVADSGNHTIRRIDLGTYAVTTIAGLAGSSGSADGVGSAARFNDPRGIAISGDGSFVLVADSGNHTVRRIDLATLAVTTLAGNPGLSGSADGIGAAARFDTPASVTLSGDGSRALVADPFNRLIRALDLGTLAVTTLAGQAGSTGYTDGTGSAARFAWPGGVSLDAGGNWALAADANGGSVRYLDVNDGTVDTLVSLPLHEDGIGNDARLNWARGIDLNADGRLALLVDTESHTVRRYDLVSGEVTTVAGDANRPPSSADGVGAVARFNYPQGGALNADGTLAYIADTVNHTIRRVDMQTGAVTTLAGLAGVSGSVDGVGGAARFNRPGFLALSTDETYLLISDTWNHTVRRLNLATLQVATVAGSAGQTGTADGLGGAARLNQPAGIAVSPDGAFALIADSNNHLLRRLDLNTGWVTRVAGWPGWNAHLDGFFDSAYLSYPRGVAISGDGSYALVTDSNSNTLRRVGLSGLDAGVVITLAGEPFEYSVADGVGADARFYWLTSVATSDDPTFALALDSEAMTVRRLGLPGRGVAPSSVLRQEWQPVAGSLHAPEELYYWLDFIDPNLLDDGRARGQLFLEADLYSNVPADATSPARRHRLASDSYPFLVDDASGGLALVSQRLRYRRNLPGYAPDDDASAVKLSGLVRNTSPGTTTVHVTVTRNDSTVVLNHSFAAMAPDELRFFTVSDASPPLGQVVYTAVSDLGSSVPATVTIQPAAASAVVSASPATIVLGQPTTLRLALSNTGVVQSFVSADLGDGARDLAPASGETVTVTRLLTPTTAGALNLPVTLSGDLTGVQSAALTVRDESVTAALSLAGRVRSTELPGDPQVVLGSDVGVVLTVTPVAVTGFDVVASYAISGPVTLEGSELITVQPGSAVVTVSLAGAPAGLYTADFALHHALLGTLITDASLDFELVEPLYALNLAATVTDLEGSVAKQIDITASSGVESDEPWLGALRLSGALISETPLSLTPGGSSASAATLTLEDRTGEQVVLVELVNADGSVAASETVTVQAAPRAAPAATLDEVSVDPGVAGGSVTVEATVGNSGPAGEAVLEVIAFDQIVEVVGEAASAASLDAPSASTAFSLTVPVPPDLLAGSYPVLVRLGDQEKRADVQITGAQIDLRQTLNASVYQPNSLATWAVELEGLAGAAAQYDVELRYGSQSHVQTVSVGAGTTVQVSWIFDVGPVSDRGTVLVQTHPLTPQQTRHSLIIDSQWVPVQEDVRAWLETDKGRYNAGETVQLTYHLETPMQSAMVLEPDELDGDPGPLLWSSLQISPTEAFSYTVTITDPVSGLPVDQTVVLTETNWLQGDFPFSYQVPDVLATGRYFFRYFFGGEERSLPIDVFGVDLKVDGFIVSGPGVAARGPSPTASGGPVTVAAKLGLNAPLASARVAAYGLGPDGEYLDLGTSAVVTMPLLSGVTPVTLSGMLTPQQPGAHQIVLMVRDAVTLAELGGESAFVDVGRASIGSLLTDQGTYGPGEPGTGELTVYGHGPTTLVVTDTVGGTLLNTVANLSGFATYSFPLNTAAVGDYLLAARTVDAAGFEDNALRAYAVPLPPDDEAPVLTLTNPSTHTVLYSDALTLTITVQGLVSDNRGAVQVYVNGQPATVVTESAWSAPVVLNKGGNALSVVALDGAGNFAAAPVISIIVTPDGDLTYGPDRTSATVGEQVTFEAVIASTGTISNAQVIQHLPPGRVMNIVATASSGVTGVVQSAQGPYITWLGDVTADTPVTVGVMVTLSAAGVLTSTATAFWGSGLTDQVDGDEVAVSGPLTVLVESFTATQVGGQALLAWETVSEIEHLGFNLYRGPAETGPWTQVNEALIPSPSPGSTGGHLYELLDPVALPPGVTWYRLEAINVSGAASNAGLVSLEQATMMPRLWLPLVVTRRE